MRLAGSLNKNSSLFMFSAVFYCISIGLTSFRNEMNVSTTVDAGSHNDDES